MQDTALSLEHVQNGTRSGGDSSRWMLRCSLAAMFLGFWFLLALSLNPHRTLTYGVQGARYAGPLTWPARWFGLNGLTPHGVTVLYSALMAILCLSYVLALYALRNDRRSSTALLIAGAFAVFTLMFVLSPPFLSRDLYSYSFNGRAMTVYHANPYLLVPAAKRGDLLYPLIGWKENATVYGPVFNMLSWVVCKLGGNSATADVLGFKLLSAACYAGCLPFVYSLARRLDPGRENLALAAAALNPLLLMHLCGGGHNDAVMALPVIAGFWMYRKARPNLGLVLVLVGVMVKVNAVLALLPYLVLYLRDVRGRPARRLGFAASSIILVTAISYLPFWDGTRIFDTTRKMFGMTSFSSVPRLAWFWLDNLLRGLGMKPSSATDLSKMVAHNVFLLIFIATVLLVLWRVRDYRTMLWAAASISLLYVLTSAYILPWYISIGLLLGVAAGWNVTTGCVLASSLVFTMYRIPEPHWVMYAAQRRSPDAHISVPLLILLVAWFVLNRGLLFGRQSNRSSSRESAVGR